MEKQYLTVSALTKYLKVKLENDPHLTRILIKGEISNFKAHDRGHFYFTLKDDKAQISAMMFSNYTKDLLFVPKEGDKVLIEAQISVYEARGSYNLSVFKMTLDGIGELYLKYEALKKEFETKGYFKEEHKRAIPKFPKAIAVITSATGAVIEDIKNTVSRRYLLTKIVLYPTLVQGEGAKENIVKQINRANLDNECDLIIIGRGGGSIEDLWAFNEREVIEAIFNSKLPVITAIGHEVDFTISDFVGDLRAPTPTAAAELATPNTIDIIEKIKEYQRLIGYHVNDKLNQLRQQLLYLDQRLEVSSPKNKVANYQAEFSKLNKLLTRNYLLLLEDKQNLVRALKLQLISPAEKLNQLSYQHQVLTKRLSDGYKLTLLEKNHQFQLFKDKLVNLNPLTYMEKGFALTLKDQKVVTTINQIQIDDTLTIRLKDGQLTTKVIDKKE